METFCSDCSCFRGLIYSCDISDMLYPHLSYLRLSVRPTFHILLDRRSVHASSMTFIRLSADEQLFNKVIEKK